MAAATLGTSEGSTHKKFQKGFLYTRYINNKKKRKTIRTVLIAIMMMIMYPFYRSIFHRIQIWRDWKTFQKLFFFITKNPDYIPLKRGSWARSRAYCSGVMQVHWGSRLPPDPAAAPAVAVEVEVWWWPALPCPPWDGDAGVEFVRRVTLPDIFRWSFCRPDSRRSE